MKKLIPLIASLFLNFIADAKTVIEDAVVFRVANQLYFLSDLSDLQKDVIEFQNWFPHSLLGRDYGDFHLLAPFKNRLPSIEEFKTKKPLPSYQELLQVLQYIKNESLNSTGDIVPWCHKANYFKQSCLKMEDLEQHPFLFHLVQSEMYLNIHYGHETFALSEGEIEHWRREMKKEKEKKDVVIKILKERKMAEAVDNFFRSIVRQIPTYPLMDSYDFSKNTSTP